MSHQMPTAPQVPHGAAASPHLRVWVSAALALLGFLSAVGSLFGSWMDRFGPGGRAVPRSLWVWVGNLGQPFGEMSAAPAGYLATTGLLLVAVVPAVVARGRVQEVARAVGAGLAVVGLVNLLGAAINLGGLFYTGGAPWPTRPGSTIWVGIAPTVLLGAAAVVAPSRGATAVPAPKPDAPRWPWTFWVSVVLSVAGLIAYVASMTVTWRVRQLHTATTTDLPETIALIMKVHGNSVGGGLVQLMTYLVATPILVLAVVPAHLLPGRAHRYGRVVAVVLTVGALGNLVAMMLDVSGLGTPNAITYTMDTGWRLGLVAVLLVGAAAVVAPGNLVRRLTRRPAPSAAAFPPPPAGVSPPPGW